VAHGVKGTGPLLAAPTAVGHDVISLTDPTFLENRARKNIKEFVSEGDGRLVGLVGLSCNTIENEAQHASK
jgi:hypothetical protein